VFRIGQYRELGLADRIVWMRKDLVLPSQSTLRVERRLKGENELDKGNERILPLLRGQQS